MDPIGTAVGKPNCVELEVPVQIGNMMNGIMNAR
jgi:hypothetical protein